MNTFLGIFYLLQLFITGTEIKSYKLFWEGINMINFVQDTENDVNLYAKFGDFNYYVSL
jgi:hypothetical protein